MFLPFVGVGRAPVRVELSARELSFGLARTHRVIDRKLPAFIERRVSADVLEARDDIRVVADATRAAALAYIPAALMLLIGGVAVLRGRLGRPLAAAALVCGLLSIAAYVGLRHGISYGEDEEPLLRRTELAPQIGALLLIVAGIGGIAGGVLGMFRPAPSPRIARPV